MCPTGVQTKCDSHSFFGTNPGNELQTLVSITIGDRDKVPEQVRELRFVLEQILTRISGLAQSLPESCPFETGRVIFRGPGPGLT